MSRAGGSNGGRGAKASVALWILPLLALLVLALIPVARDYIFETRARRVEAVSFPGGMVVVDVAVTQREREQGLSGRESLPPSAGMLFIYRDTAPRRFVMDGMLFGLDIIALDEAGVVVGIFPRVPGDPPIDLPPCRYVLEVGQGYSEAHGVAVGTQAAIVSR